MISLYNHENLNFMSIPVHFNFKMIILPSVDISCTFNILSRVLLTIVKILILFTTLAHFYCNMYQTNQGF